MPKNVRIAGSAIPPRRRLVSYRVRHRLVPSNLKESLLGISPASTRMGLETASAINCRSLVDKHRESIADSTTKCGSGQSRPHGLKSGNLIVPYRGHQKAHSSPPESTPWHPHGGLTHRPLPSHRLSSPRRALAEATKISSSVPRSAQRLPPP